MAGFPRSKDRGLIEAPPILIVAVSVEAHFPRSKDRGLIEAWFPVFGVFRIQVFPRSKDRGLIEA